LIDSAPPQGPGETEWVQNMNDAGEAYLRWFYDSGIWKNMTWGGVRTLKLPGDMWNYQEIIHERRIDYVIEAGTRHGGSALFFAQALAARNARGFVISIDVDDSARQIREHERIEFLLGNSADPDVVDDVLAMLAPERGPLFLILDSDHSRDHVLAELRAWIPRLRAGDYVVVEDTIVNGHPVRPEFGPGPMEAIEQYLQESPGLLMHDALREAKFGPTCAVKGYYIRQPGKAD
jgi:cephalosporin hydroxylase